ncbi:MAG: exodeoxyribonuclease VII large subunit [Opitutales bacterium]|nr:exodeoxyribonuclease VII large subunit [Opitutales bacterium]
MEFLKRSDEILSVSEFSARFKSLVKMSVPELWLRGEISNVKTYSSGHVYFTLKDEGAAISAVLFKGYAKSLNMRLADGMKILAYGEVSVYEARGSYQIILKAVLPDGGGDLAARFEELKRRLSAEGLFDKSRKKEIPCMPKKVCVITSPTGAAIRDFLSILGRRGWRGDILILPSRVQGSAAAEEIVSQISAAEEIKPDLLVITRGGGSLEDLWSFNEEVLARAVAACKIPTISAVGHEIDFTLCDFSADLRAETPSAAAEYISSGFLRAKDDVINAFSKIESEVKSGLKSAAERLDACARLFAAAEPRDKIANLKISLDKFEGALISAAQNAISAKRESLNPQASLLAEANPHYRLGILKARLNAAEESLELLSVDSVLKRGFAYLESENGALIQNAGAVPFDAALKLHFSDGSVNVKRY